MKVTEAILKRRSIRKFTDQEISDEVIQKILVNAMAAPSARNQQPWEFFVIKSKNLQDKIKSVASNYNFNSTLTIVVCGNKERSLTQNDNDFWIQDCSSSIENMLLTVTELGLGAVWCGCYPVLERSTKVQEILDLNQKIIPLAVIQIGYPDEEKEERTQFNPNYIHYL